MASLARIYFASFLVLATVMRCSSRSRGVPQPPCQCSIEGPMDVIHVGDVCSCPRHLSFDVEAPRPVEEPDRPKEYGFRVEMPRPEHPQEQTHSYHMEVEVPFDPKRPSPPAEYGFKVEVPRSPGPEELRSYSIDIHEPRRDVAERNPEYSFHIDRMAVPRRDCCVHDD